MGGAWRDDFDLLKEPSEAMGLLDNWQTRMPRTKDLWILSALRNKEWQRNNTIIDEKLISTMRSILESINAE